MSSENLNFEKAIPLNTEIPLKQPDKEIETINTVDGLDFSEATIEENIQPESQVVDGLDFSSVESVQPENQIVDGLDFSTATIEEPSTWEKLEYGWDKETWVVGDALRIAKAAIQGGFDSQKTWKDYILQNEANRVKDFEEEHWKMLDGKYDGIYTTIGSGASWLTDPYYLMGFYFGRGLLANPLTSMAFNAALMGGGNIVHQLAKTGEVNWGETATTAGFAGAIGLVLPYGGQLFKKFTPTGKEATKIANWIDDKIADKNGFTKPELNRFRQIANTEKVKKLTDEINIWSNNFYSKQSKILDEFNNLKIDYNKTRKTVNELNKQIIGKEQLGIWSKKLGRTVRRENSKTISALRQELKDAKKIADDKLKKLNEQSSSRVNKYYELEGKRAAAIVEQINATDNFAQKALKAVMANITRPLAFGAVGGGANVLFGDEDDFWTWVAAGAAFGAAQKGIMGSKKFQIGQKNEINGWLISDATSFTLAKVRALLAGTNFTKLSAYGGPLEKFARLTMRGIDDSIASKSVLAEEMKMTNLWNNRINEVFKNKQGIDFKPEEISQAISINRGNKELIKTVTPEVKKLADDIKSFTENFQKFAKEAGYISPQKIEDYFPRVLDYAKIDASKESRKATEKIIADIYRSLGVSGKIKNKKSPNYGKDKADVYAVNYLEGHKNNFDSVLNNEVWNSMVTGTTYKGAARGEGAKSLIYTPVSDHITHRRSLMGPYEKVEKILEKNGLLINDGKQILNKLVQDTVKSVAFSRKFGANGQGIRKIIKEIQEKYSKSTLSEAQQKMAVAREADLMGRTIDAYFNRYMISGRNQLKASMGIITMLANLNMLGRVTISSLGDLVQPFQNSINWTSAIRGLLRTNLRAAGEKGPARNLNYHFTDEMSKSVFKSAGLEGNEVAFRNGFMGKWGIKDAAKTSTWNNIAFKLLGLEWLTGYARRFAYNTGARDAHILARRYFKTVQGKGKNSNAALNILDDLQKYQITANEALSIGAIKNFNKALSTKYGRESLNRAGMTASNRDALIPQMDNRLLFTQSQTPWIRILGQFLSWAMAKSSQTNKIISRIENGDVRTLIKTLAVIPVYGGIQQLRELAKNGEVHTHPEYDMAKFLAKSGQLSGMPGWQIDLFMNRFMGPGKRDPWFMFAPAMQILTTPGVAAKKLLEGKPDDALRALNKRFLPFPNWRRWFQRMWFPRKVVDWEGNYGSKLKFNRGGVARQKFSIGKVASKIGVASLKKLKLLDDVAPEETAISNTINTYKKVDNMLTDLNKVSVHDAGSGLGYGKDIFTKSSNPKVYSGHDPYSKKIKDKIAKETKEFEGQLFKGHVNKHENFDEVFAAYGTGSKDAVVNLNVLNVIGDLAERQKVVKDISKLINDNGVAVITTRGWKNDVLKQAQKHYGNDWKKYLINDGFIFKKGNKKTFQTGFDRDGDKKLTTYVREILGDNFLVQRIPRKYNISSTGVMISKVKDKLSNLKNEVTKIDSSLKRNSSTGVGKKIGGDLYVHKSSENVIPNLISFKSKLPSNYKYDVVKYNDKDKIVSFIKVPEFNIVQEPLATTGLKVFSDGTIKNININQIYHHKWLFVDDSYKGFNIADSIERSLAWLPLRKNNKIKDFKWASIGRQEAWDKVIPFIPKLSVGGQVARLGLSGGDIIPPIKPTKENKDMNKKDVTALAAAATIAATASQVDKLLPKEKPDIKPNVVIEKTYENVSDLEPAKKKWLLETAKKVYTINKDEVIPSDIILAINGGETGWGTSRFWNEGSNNLFNFQSFDDKEESIDALNSNAKIKKFKSSEDSIIQFLDWVQNKDTYAGVREEIKLYNEGKGSKERIIDAIAKTGFAEDKNWSSKIKSILNNRIDGKHKEELASLEANLFVDNE